MNAHLLNHYAQDGVLLRWVLACLPSLLAALHPRDAWAAIMPGFALLLHHALAHKPKVQLIVCSCTNRMYHLLWQKSVCFSSRCPAHDPAQTRKVAQAGVEAALAAWQQHPRAQPSSAVITTSTHVLAGPEAAAKAAANAPASQRAAAEVALMDSVADALHWLALLERCAAFLEPSSQASLVRPLFALLPLHQPLLTRHALGVLLALARGGLPAAAVVEVIGVVLQQVWRTMDDALYMILHDPQPKTLASKDINIALNSLQLVGTCLQRYALLLPHQPSTPAFRLQSLDPTAAAQQLPTAVRGVLPLLLAEAEALRRAAAGQLQDSLRACITPTLVAQAVAVHTVRLLTS